MENYLMGRGNLTRSGHGKLIVFALLSLFSSSENLTWIVEKFRAIKRGAFVFTSWNVIVSVRMMHYAKSLFFWDRIHFQSSLKLKQSKNKEACWSVSKMRKLCILSPRGESPIIVYVPHIKQWAFYKTLEDSCGSYSRMSQYEWKLGFSEQTFYFLM